LQPIRFVSERLNFIFGEIRIAPEYRMRLFGGVVLVRLGMSLWFFFFHTTISCLFKSTSVFHGR
jgi:hypothetical protein